MQPLTHWVQFYQADKKAFIRNVGRYLREGLAEGETVLVIASAPHRAELARELRNLGADPDAAIRDNQLVSLDSSRTLERFMVDGEPDWERFKDAIEARILNIQSPGGGTRSVRAYHDLAGVLWKAGLFAAAIRLEEFWNRLIAARGFKIFCGYPIDVFGAEFHSPDAEQLLHAHAHVVPAGVDGDLVEALDRSMSEILGPEGCAEVHARTPVNHLPSGEGLILSLRSRSGRADEILARARGYYDHDQRFRSLTERMYDAIALVDESGVISYASVSIVSVLGFDPSELLGSNAFDLIHPDDLESTQKALAAAIAEPRSTVQARAKVRSKDNRWLWIEFSATSLLEQPEIAAIVLNFRDVSAEIAAEREGRGAVEQLGRARQERQQIARAAATEFKNSIRKIRTFGHLLTQREQLDDSGKQFARMIVENAEEVSDLLNGLITFISLESSDPVVLTGLANVVEAAVRKLEGAIQETQATIVVDAMPSVLINPSQFVLLFQNLIDNAIRFRGSEPPHISVFAERLGGEWVIKVQDNGIGIGESYHQAIFEIFHRLPNSQISRSGTGLAICKKIVELAGGKIWVESSVGQGSTFCLTLPANAAH
jgi:PAS domain S-box-containing protein